MLEALTEQDLEFCELFYTPVAMAECIVSDFDNLMSFEDDKLAELRLAQYPLLSHEYIVDEEMEGLSDKEKFNLRKGAGDVYCFGGRLFGKSLITEKIDLLVAFMCLGAEHVGFSSCDALHIRGILESVVTAAQQHPLIKQLTTSVNRSPNYRMSFKSGLVLESVNMNLFGQNPGKAFFQKHFHRLYIEEASLETEAVYKIRRDSISELGCILRVAGMTNFTRHSPAGKVFYDNETPLISTQVINLPQVVNPRWDAEAKRKAIQDFGGEQSIGYKIFIWGEIVEDGVSVFDMNRVKKCLNEEKEIKHFEVTKENFLNFENIVVVERPKNAESCIIFADIGETAPTEVGIAFKINNKFHYVYNVTLYGLTDKEQFKFFRWLGQTLLFNVMALDTTDGTSRAIFRSLAEVFPPENLIAVSFNEKLAVDFEKDDKGNVVLQSGKPVYKEEYVSEWSVKHLKDILYGELIEIPIDHKFLTQINSVMVMQSGMRLVYKCTSEEDHLFQAFQVFSIAHWNIEFSIIKPIKRIDYYKSGV